MNPEVSALHNYAALGISGLSIGAKELLFRYTLYVVVLLYPVLCMAQSYLHHCCVCSSAVQSSSLIISDSSYILQESGQGGAQ